MLLIDEAKSFTVRLCLGLFVWNTAHVKIRFFWNKNLSSHLNRMLKITYLSQISVEYSLIRPKCLFILLNICTNWVVVGRKKVLCKHQMQDDQIGWFFAKTIIFGPNGNILGYFGLHFAEANFLHFQNMVCRRYFKVSKVVWRRRFRLLNWASI